MGPVGQAIRELRERRNMTQRELAAKSGLHLTSLGAYERGSRTPKLDSLARICFALDVEPSTFCLEVARAEAGRLAPLVDQLRKNAGLERPVGSQQASQFEELRWASDLVFDSMKDLFFSMVTNAYEKREGGPDGSRQRERVPEDPRRIREEGGRNLGGAEINPRFS